MAFFWVARRCLRVGYCRHRGSINDVSFWGHEELGAPDRAGFVARVEVFGGRHQMGLQWGRSVQPLSGPRAVTRSHPNPKSRSYESLFFFSSPARSLLYSFLFQANEPAVKETRIPLYNLRQAWPGCSFSIKQSFSCLSFPVPWHPNWKHCALPHRSVVWGGTRVPLVWCTGSAPAALAEGVDLLSGRCRQPCRAVPSRAAPLRRLLHFVFFLAEGTNFLLHEAELI